MGLKRLGKDKYEIRLKYMEKESRRVFRGSRAEAELALSALKNEIQAAKADGQIWQGFAKLKASARQLTFKEASDEYMGTLTRSSPNTIHANTLMLRVHILPCLGAKPVRRFDQRTLTAFRSHMEQKLSTARNRKGKPLSNKTINNNMRLVLTVLNFCERNGELDKVPKLRCLPTISDKIDPLSFDELQSVLVCVSDYWRPAITILGATGIRPGELVALRWSDVDFKRKEIHIGKALALGVERAPKTKASVRYVPLAPMALAAFQELKDRSTPELNDHKEGKSSRVIVSREGERLTGQISNNWGKALQKAGLHHRSSYQLRHTFASLALQEGATPGWIGQVLGHSSLAITFKHYLRYIPSDSERNLAIVNNLFGQATENSPRMINTGH